MRIFLSLERENYDNIIICLQGPGLVGPIVGEYLVEYCKFRESGFLIPEESVPLAIIIDGKIYHPVRIFSKGATILILVDITLPSRSEVEFYKLVREIYGRYKVKRIIIVNGMESIDRSVYFVSNYKERVEGKKLKEGILTGIPALFLLDKGTNSTLLLGGVKEKGMDPESALNILKVISNLLEEKIPLKPLEEEIKKFKERIPKIKEKVGMVKERIFR